MKRNMQFITFVVAITTLFGVNIFSTDAASTQGKQTTPVLNLTWSEYPSWSAIGVAGNADVGLINPNKGGKPGTLEKKWNVDIVLKLADYNTCIELYGSGECEAVCITNMDLLTPSLNRKSVAVLPTSTSYGADALVVDSSISDLKALKGKEVYGLELSVSEYFFTRALEKSGENPKEYKFANMDPAAAATAMQTRQKNAIVVWNPFVLETLEKRKDTRRLVDSTIIPAEIIDMVAFSEEFLKRDGAERAVCAVIEAYYAICQRMRNPEMRDDTLIAIGEKFSNLGLQKMRECVQQTVFYETPELGIQLFDGGKAFPFKKGVTDDTLKQIMPRVVDFCVKRGMVEKKPIIAYDRKDAANTNFIFDSSYMKAVAKSR